jgi:hypothetical protein
VVISDLLITYFRQIGKSIYWEGNKTQELEQAFLLPSFTVFETMTCLFTYLAWSGNAFRRKRLSGGALTCGPVTFEVAGIFGWVCIRCCAASQQKQGRKQPQESLTHRYSIPFYFVSETRISGPLFWSQKAPKYCKKKWGRRMFFFFSKYPSI